MINRKERKIILLVQTTAKERGRKKVFIKEEQQKRKRVGRLSRQDQQKGRGEIPALRHAHQSERVLLPEDSEKGGGTFEKIRRREGMPIGNSKENGCRDAMIERG